MVASRLSVHYCEAKGMSVAFAQHDQQSTLFTDGLFVVRRLQELGRARLFPPVHVLHRPAESVRLRRPRSVVGGDRTLRRIREDAGRFPSVALR